MNPGIDISGSREPYLPELLELWEESVRATHRFLKEEDITALKPLVVEGLRQIPQLFCISAPGTDRPGGFMGVADGKLEMLFLGDAGRGHGLGKRLLRYAIDELHITGVDVNEQNPKARGFYEHFGFKVFDRSETDSSGNPFPILHMRR